MVIIVDVREPEFIRNYLKRNKVETVVKEIDFCDYIVNAKDYIVFVERKTSQDFVKSILDGRVFNQAYMMSTLAPVSYIVVEGVISEALVETKFPRKAYIGALSSLVLKRSPYGCRGHISVISVETELDTAEFLRVLHSQLEEGKLERLPRVPLRGKKVLDKRGVTIAMLQTIPGVGLEKAKKIAERFSSIKELIEADVRQIASIEGISLTLAERIKSFLT